MKNMAALIVSVMCMGVALSITLSGNQTAGEAYGMEVPELTVTTTVESPPATSESAPVTSVTLPSTITPVEVVTPVYEAPVTASITSTPQEDEEGWDCTLSGNRVCGVPDEAGIVHLVCHNINGTPVRIVSNAYNCV
jgi:hypothetical protein